LLVPFVAFELHKRRLRRLAIERAIGKRPPVAWPLRVERAGVPFIESAEFSATSRTLRRRQVGDAMRLSIERTVAATLDARGFPPLRFISDTRPPEYLLLIERSSPRDHFSRLVGDIADALRRNGVHAIEYYFDRDSRLLCARDTRKPTLLGDVHRQHPSH